MYGRGQHNVVKQLSSYKKKQKQKQKQNRIKDPDCIPNFPGPKGKPPVSESPAELVKNRHSLFKIHNIKISVLGSLSNLDA